jgi:hypothetical protein
MENNNVSVYELIEANNKLNICDDLSVEKNRNLIFIYCPPKVGSTTIVSSIRISAYDKFTVLHIHDELMLKVLCNIENIKVIDIIKYNSSIGKNVYVIDIYRSPIEQKISQYFEKLSTFHFNNSPLLINNYNVDKIIKRFNSLFPHLSNEDHYQDAYKIPIPKNFDYHNKYILQNIDGIKYIKLRLKDSNDWHRILSNILNVKIIIINDYETNNKPIKDMFKKFNEQYNIPDNLLKMIYECPKLKYYYSPEERNEYLNKWESKKTWSYQPFSYDEFEFYERISNENKYMVEVQRTHYLDEGCSCKACQMKRNKIIAKIQRGEKVNEKIIHNESKIEYLNEQAKNMKVYTIKKTSNQSANQNKLKSTFGNSIKKSGVSGFNINI